MNGRSILLCVALTGAARSLSGQEHPIEFSAALQAPEARVRPGAAFTMWLAAVIPPGWHLYSITQPPGGPIATKIFIGPEGSFRLGGRIDGSIPDLENDPNFGMVTETHSDSARFSIPVRAISTLGPGRHRVEVRVGYQTCNARYCLPPAEDTLTATVDVGGEAVVDETPPPATADPATASSPPSVASPPTEPAPPSPASTSLLLFLSLAATMGALSLLTPCVFPMVPITITYFSRGAHRGRRAAAVDAALYGMGIVGAFTGLGLALALIFGVAGLNRFAANPWLNLAIAALFIGFASSLFGVVNLSLPPRLLGWLDSRSNVGTIGRTAGTLAMGGTFAATSFTCTAPFVGTLLVSAAQGDWRWPAMGLLVFSSVFALPFLILALVPEALSRLPRSGEWMVTLKGSLAFIELAAAFKFISNADLVQGWGIFSRGAVIAIWVVLGIALVAYLVGIRPGAGRVLSRGRLIAAGAAAVATTWLATGLTGRRLGEIESFLPPAGADRGGIGGGEELSWRVDDYPGALEEARQTGKLVLIDFTGFTCTNCRWMEANMFPRVAVREKLGDFVRVRLFTDGNGERYRQQQKFEQERFATVALPLYAIVDSSGASRGVFLGMTRDTDEFVRFLSGK